MSASFEHGRPSGLVPRPHLPVSGVPYYDEDLDVAHGKPHRIMVGETVPILSALAEEIGLTFLSDESIWYLHPETDEQRTFFGDLVLARLVDITRITAADVLLVLEVVSTNDRRKELKDTRFQRLLNEYNQVPEFALVFPDLGDARALTWCRLVDGEYQEQIVAPGGSVQSDAVPGLELRVLPRERWSEGYKLDIVYQGVLRPRLRAERERAEQERERAEQERERAEQAQQQAEQAQQQAEQAQQQAEQAQQQAEQAQQQAEQAQQRVVHERERADRLAALLRAHGLDPEP